MIQGIKLLSKINKGGTTGNLQDEIYLQKDDRGKQVNIIFRPNTT
jgi:hypothetical protein